MLNLNKFTGAFPAAFGLTSFSISSPTALKQFNADAVTQSGDSFTYPAYANEHPTGTGPFKFESYNKASQTITLVRNEEYWGEKAKLDKLIFKIIPDENARKQELAAGTIDGYDLPSPADYETLKDTGNQQVGHLAGDHGPAFRARAGGGRAGPVRRRRPAHALRSAAARASGSRPGDGVPGPAVQSGPAPVGGVAAHRGPARTRPERGSRGRPGTAGRADGRRRPAGGRAAPVPARVLRRAAAADRHRPRAVCGAGPDRRRRAGVRIGRLGAGAGAQRAVPAAARAWPDLPGDRARPGRRPARERPGRGDVPGRDRRGGSGPDPQVEDDRERILLSGDLPSPAAPPPGCRFHPRCSWRQDDRCDTERPELRVPEGAGPEHRVACHHAEAIRDGRIARHAVQVEAVDQMLGTGPAPRITADHSPSTWAADPGPAADAARP